MLIKKPRWVSAVGNGLREHSVSTNSGQIARPGLDENKVFPVAPDGPGRIAGVTRVGLVNDEVEKDRRTLGIIISATDDVLPDPPRVHVGIVAEVGPVGDIVVTDRECRLIEIVDGGHGLVDAPVAEIPVVVAVGVIGIHRSVVAVDIEASVGIAVAIEIRLAFMTGDLRRRGLDRNTQEEHEPHE